MNVDLSFPRRFGQFVLLAKLGDDGLGSVYRALASSEEKRFLRLRILQSPELLPEEVTRAIARNSIRATGLAHKAIALRAEMGILEGVPFVAWCDSGGWTLAVVLAPLRAPGTILPTEYALLIAERLAAALAQAWFSLKDGEPFHHGLLWPGFVSISSDAETRVGGFGLAEGVLPSLEKPRLQRDIAPYLPPEVRSAKRVGVNSDVYSVGVLLLELLTGRRARLDPPLAELRIEDPFAIEIGEFLRSCLAEPAKRFSSVVQMQRSLQELLAASPYALSTASLAIFLYKLLNPESRAVPVTDGESTNPVSFESSAAESVPPAPATPVERRQRPAKPLLPSTTHREAAFPRPAPPPSDTKESGPAAGAARETLRKRLSRGVPQTRARPVERRRASVAAVMTIASALGLALIATILWLARGRESSQSFNPSTSRVAPAAPTRSPSIAPPAPATDKREPRAARSRSRAPARRSANPEASDGPEESETLRKSAEDSRLAAALARVESERAAASDLAETAFGRARSSEQEAERSFFGGDWNAAQAAFERATKLYREAESLAREERVRRVKLLPADAQ